MSAKYLSPKQVATRWSVAKSTVYALIASGMLPHVRVGLGRGTIRIREEDADAYLARRKRDDEKTYAEHFS